LGLRENLIGTEQEVYLIKVISVFVDN